MPQAKGAFRAKRPVFPVLVGSFAGHDQAENFNPILSNPILSSSINLVISIVFSLFFLPSLLLLLLLLPSFSFSPSSSILYSVFFHLLYCLRAYLYHRSDVIFFLLLFKALQKTGTFHKKDLQYLLPPSILHFMSFATLFPFILLISCFPLSFTLSPT